MNHDDMFSKLKSLCERTPSQEAFKALVEHAEQMWCADPKDDTHDAWFAYLRAKLMEWYAQCPVEYDADYWAEPAIIKDPFTVKWRDVWLGLCHGTEQVERYDANGQDWPVPIRATSEHHSWMKLIRTLHIGSDDFGDLDFHLFGQAQNLQPSHLSVELPNPYCDWDRNMLFAFPNFVRLHSLCFPSIRCSPDNLRSLIAPLGSSFEYLSMTDTGQGNAIATALAENPNLANLSVLELSRSGLDDRGCEQLGKGLSSANLQELYLSECAIGDVGISNVVRAPWFATVRKLILHGNRIGDAGAHALATCPHSAQLEELSLFNNAMTVEGVDALIASPYLRPEIIESMKGLRAKVK